MAKKYKWIEELENIAIEGKKRLEKKGIKETDIPKIIERRRRE